MIAIFWVSLSLAASQPRVVHAGETAESIAQELGDPSLADEIRQMNGLTSGAQPEVGAVLLIPVEGDLHTDGGVVLTLSGSGQATPPGGGVVPLSLGLPLPEGTAVCTGDQSYATLRLALAHEGQNHDDITLLSNTCAVVEAARSRPGARVSLVSLSQGSLSVRAAPDSPGTVAIRTESGLTAGEGGGFRVTVEEDAARTEALYSAVSVIGAGQEVPMEAGYGSRTHTGEAPSEPVPLLPPGQPTAPPEGEALLRPDFAWTEVERALGYRLEISSSSDFSALILVEEVPTPLWSPEIFFVPFRVEGLWWRVSSFDRAGFLGLPSDPSALVFPVGMGP